MERIRTESDSAANSETLLGRADAQSQHVLQILLHAPGGNFEQISLNDRIRFVEKTAFSRLQEQFQAMDADDQLPEKQDELDRSIDDITRYMLGETTEEIGADTNRWAVEVEDDIAEMLSLAISATPDYEIAYRREYRALFPGFKPNAYPGLLRVIRSSEPDPGQSREQIERMEGPAQLSERRRPQISNISEIDNMGLLMQSVGDVELLKADQEIELSKRIEAGLIAEKAMGKFASQLTGQEREELEWLAEDGRHAKEHLYLANLRLVVSIARKFPETVVLSRADYVQEGYWKLMHAVELFDYTKGYKFSTYANNWIMQAMQRLVANTDELVRKPVAIVGEIRRLNGVEAGFRKRGVIPTEQMLADEMKCEVERVKDLKHWRMDPASLDAPIGNEAAEENTLLNLLTDGKLEIEAQDAENLEDQRAVLDRLLSELDDVSVEILLCRNGFRLGRPETLKEVASHLNLSYDKVNVLEKQAMSYLRDIVGETSLAG